MDGRTHESRAMYLSLPHPHHGIRRPGNVTLYFLVFMGLTVPTMFWTINIWRIAEGKISQQRVCDACALAAVGMLTEEFNDPMAMLDYSTLLYGDKDEIEELCQTHATQEAKNYAGSPTPSTLFSNYVDGAPLAFEIKDDNDKDDIQYGFYDFGSATPTFTPIDPAGATTDERRTINAVRVVAIRSVERGNSVPLFGPAWTGSTNAQIVTRATAVLDRRVIGFRLHSKQSGTGTLGYQKIPLAPVALLNDASANSWATAVEKPAAKSIADGDAKIKYGTMTVIVPTNTTPAATLNSKLLDIGITDFDGLARQLKDGINGADVAVYGQDLIIDKTTYTLPVPQFAVPKGDKADTDFDKLYQAFLTLKTDGTERAWPLTQAVPATGDVTVSGFVAARITDVQIMQHAGSAPTDYIQLTLQPTLMNTPTAFTDYSGRFLKSDTPKDPNPYDGYSRLINPYIGRIRVVE